MHQQMAVRNGDYFGIQSAMLTFTTSAAVYAHQIARKDTRIQAFGCTKPRYSRGVGTIPSTNFLYYVKLIVAVVVLIIILIIIAMVFSDKHKHKEHSYPHYDTRPQYIHNMGT